MKTERILFIQTAFPGDAILTLPAIEMLKLKFPESTIDVLCIPSTKEIFNSSPFVDNTIIIDKKGKHKTLISTYKFVKQLKKNNYSLLYSSHRSLRTSLIVLLMQIRESYGFDNSSLMHVYKNLIVYDSSKHEVQRNLDLVGFTYDEDNWKILPKITAETQSIEKVNNFINQNNLNDGFIAVSPGSVWNTKRYPLEYFEDVIKYFTDKNYKIVLIGGKDDKQLCEKISSKFLKNVVNAADEFSIAESIQLLRSAKLLLSNDSAPTHMGMCADVRVLTIYCSTVPEFGFYPYNKNSSFISYNDLKCKPCGIHGHYVCPIKTFECGINLLPGQIISKMEEMLSA